MDPFPEALARSVRERRRSLGLTQRELATLSGVGLAFLYDLERGKETVRLDKVLDVLAVLGLRMVVDERAGGVPGGDRQP